MADRAQNFHRHGPRQSERRAARGQVVHDPSTRPLEPSKQPARDHVDLTVVIPLFNEAESLVELSIGLKKVLDDSRLKYEIFFVDDGSTDNSFKILQEMHQLNRQIKAIRFRRNFGKSAALSAGFQAANGAVIVTMDADLQDDPAEIPRLMEKLRDGYDLVSGWKKKRWIQSQKPFRPASSIL